MLRTQTYGLTTPLFLKTKERKTNKNKQTTATTKQKSKHIETKTKQKTETKNLIVFYAVFKLCRLIKKGVFNIVDVFQGPFSFLCDFIYTSPCKTGVANSTTKNVGLGKFWQDLEISEAFLISLEVSFLHGLFLLF